LVGNEYHYFRRLSFLSFQAAMSLYRFSRPILALGLLLAAPALLISCDRSASPPAAEVDKAPAPEQAATESTAPAAPEQEAGAPETAPEPIPDSLGVLPFGDRATGLLLEDLDKDGKLEVLLVSHGGNTAIPFKQVAPRKYEAGPPVEFVGFHPNDIIHLPFSDGSKYLVNAEGEGRLRLFSFDGALNSTMSSEIPVAAPKFTTPFTWPGWGESLAVTQFTGPNISFVKGLDVNTGKYADAMKVEVTTSPRLVPSLPVTVDLDGDGIDELVYPVPKSRTVQMLRWAGENEPPTSQTLWNSPGGTPHFAIPVLLDGDDRYDLIVVGNTLKAVHVLINEGDFKFRDARYDLGDAIATGSAFAKDASGKRYLAVVTTSKFFLFEFPAEGAEPANIQSVDNIYRGISRVAMDDLDGDGHVDVVITRNAYRVSNVIVYGPLDQNFQELSKETALLPMTVAKEEQKNAH